VLHDPMTIGASAVLTPNGWVDRATVVVDGGRIVDVRPATGAVPDRVLAPGFVDLQVNGIDDIDVSRADGEDWERLDAALLAQGVTAWCPTLVTAPLGWYAAPLQRLRDAMHRPPAARPTILGVHLEGPFLGGAPGAHRRDHLVPVDLSWLEALPDHVAMVTIAPECPGAPAAIRRLAGRGVLVSIGHTTAGVDDVAIAVDAGASMATHLFNAMSGLHHRDPGVAATVLTDRRLDASLIADGIHVHPTMLRLAFEVLGDRAILVTDAVAWLAGTAGTVGMAMVDGAPRLPDGTLAGSALTMDAAIRTCVAAGVDLAAALHAASSRPARRIGAVHLGRLEPGAPANLVALTPDLRVEHTWVV
jgi:N-acetylglucosamine-6-phosphate deacetylase